MTTRELNKLLDLIIKLREDLCSKYTLMDGPGSCCYNDGITSSITWGSKLIIIFLMFAGRCGALTLFSAFLRKGRYDKAILKCPEGNILVG